MENEIEMLRERVSKLEKALKPFADSYAQIKINWTKIPNDMTYSVSVKDLGKAHEALAGIAGKC